MPTPDPGLCARCEHAHLVEGARSTFVRCQRHGDEPDRFPRFPELPVAACPGFEEGAPDRSRRGT